jgi:hypothetical protein
VANRYCDKMSEKVRRPEPVGGLTQSPGGWKDVKMIRLKVRIVLFDWKQGAFFDTGRFMNQE